MERVPVIVIVFGLRRGDESHTRVCMFDYCYCGVGLNWRLSWLDDRKKVGTYQVTHARHKHTHSVIIIRKERSNKLTPPTARGHLPRPKMSGPPPSIFGGGGRHYPRSGRAGRGVRGCTTSTLSGSHHHPTHTYGASGGQRQRVGGESPVNAAVHSI
ncbi:hypothetical protein Ddc_08009 [Ditylenchus destructor]|nr:hypothetical protein Ddc_08009 [Ditylenchus destructor]